MEILGRLRGIYIFNPLKNQPTDKKCLHIKKKKKINMKFYGKGLSYQQHSCVHLHDTVLLPQKKEDNNNNNKIIMNTRGVKRNQVNPKEYSRDPFFSQQVAN